MNEGCEHPVVAYYRESNRFQCLSCSANLTEEMRDELNA